MTEEELTEPNFINKTMLFLLPSLMGHKKTFIESLRDVHFVAAILDDRNTYEDDQFGYVIKRRESKITETFLNQEQIASHYMLEDNEHIVLVLNLPEQYVENKMRLIRGEYTKMYSVGFLSKFNKDYFGRYHGYMRTVTEAYDFAKSWLQGVLNTEININEVSGIIKPEKEILNYKEVNETSTSSRKFKVVPPPNFKM